MQYLLDTDICIAFLKGKNDLLRKVEKVGFDNCFVSEITIGELIYGAYYSINLEKHKGEVSKIEKLFQVIPIYEALEVFGKEKARLRKSGNLIHDFDLLIGSTAVHFKMVMVTNNERHLGRVKEVRIQNWIKDEVK